MIRGAIRKIRDEQQLGECSCWRASVQRHLLTNSINMWQQLFVKCGIFFSLFSGILNADFEQEALSIPVAIITQLFTEILRVVHALEIWDKANLCGGES